MFTLVLHQRLWTSGGPGVTGGRKTDMDDREETSGGQRAADAPRSGSRDGDRGGRQCRGTCAAAEHLASWTEVKDLLFRCVTGNL